MTLPAIPSTIKVDKIIELFHLARMDHFLGFTLPPSELDPFFLGTRVVVNSSEYESLISPMPLG